MNKSNNKKYTPTKKEQKLAIFITIFAIIVLGGITYTFFSSAVSNTNNEKIQTQTATMSLEFDDGDNGISANLNLGESIVKKFTLENTGTVDAYAKINWYNLVNTYTANSLTWTLEQSTTENGTYTSVGSGNVPTSSAATSEVLKNGLLIPVSTTYYYKLTITLNNLDAPQNSDINATMYTHFNLEQGNEEITAVEYIRKLVKDANPSSIEETVGTPVNQYSLKFSGIHNSSEQQYNSLDDCEYDADWFTQVYGNNVSASCALDTTTNKFNLILNGDSSDSNYYTYGPDEISSCENDAQSGNNTTCELLSTYCNTLAYDGTVDNNLRYVGANPCNYVNIDNYQARIIGVMNNVDDGTGLNESRLKVVFLFYGFWEISWGITNNYDYSDVKDLVLSDCLSSEIKPAKRYLKSFPTTENLIRAGDLYDIEKVSGSVYPGNPSSAISLYSVPNPSDLVAAVGGSMRTSCLSKNVLSRNYNSSAEFYNSDCAQNTWTSHLESDSWTILAASNNNSDAYHWSNNGITPYNTDSDPNALLVAYLDPNVKILDGKGTYKEPYIIGKNNCNFN